MLCRWRRPSGIPWATAYGDKVFACVSALSRKEDAIRCLRPLLGSSDSNYFAEHPFSTRSDSLSPRGKSKSEGQERPRGTVMEGLPSSDPASELPTETVRKGVRATLRACIWPVYGGWNGPKSPSLAARRATLQAPPKLFGQFRKGRYTNFACRGFSEVRLKGLLRSSPVLLFVTRCSNRSVAQRPLGALLAQYSLPGGRGVGHQLAQCVTELGEACLSNCPCPLALGGEAHVA